MVRLVVHRSNGTVLEITAATWQEAFAQVKDANAESMEGETMVDEDWDEH